MFALFGNVRHSKQFNGQPLAGQISNLVKFHPLRNNHLHRNRELFTEIYDYLLVAFGALADAHVHAYRCLFHPIRNINISFIWITFVRCCMFRWSVRRQRIFTFRAINGVPNWRVWAVRYRNHIVCTSSQKFVAGQTENKHHSNLFFAARRLCEFFEMRADWVPHAMCTHWVRGIGEKHGFNWIV